jgi:hypothetical protein
MSHGRFDFSFFVFVVAVSIVLVVVVVVVQCCVSCFVLGMSQEVR